MKGRVVAGLLAAGFLVLGIWVLRRQEPSAAPTGSEAPAGAVDARPALPPDAAEPFYVGISSLDVEENERAGRLFEELSRELPGEPAVWANLGLARLRLGDLEGAETALAAAAERAPGNARIAVLQAIIDEFRGDFPRAIERLRSLPDPDAAVLYRLANLLARTGSEADPREQLAILDRLAEQQPDNLVVAFDRARLLARLADQSRLEAAIDALESHREGWSEPAVRQWDAIRAAVADGNFRSAATSLTFLQNLAASMPAYQASLAVLDAAGGSIGQPLRTFLTFRAPEVVVAPVDDGLTWAERPNDSLAAPPDLYRALILGEESGASLVTLADGELRLPGGVGLAAAGTEGIRSRHALCAADVNGDALQDLVLNGGAGVGIWLQNENGGFTAWTPPDELRSVLTQPGRGVWPLDFEADGDLDLLVARDGTAPQLLRNNGDGGFSALDAFASFPEVREVCWSDFDADGDSDLGLLDVAGRVLISWNDRAGLFTSPSPVTDAPAIALAVGDVAGTGEMALVALAADGVVNRLTFDRVQRAWIVHELARWTDPSDLADAAGRGRVSLDVADLDNNGAVDLVASADAVAGVWLNAGGGRFQRLEAAPALFVMSIEDVDGDGLLDLVGVTEAGAGVAHARGTKGYHWQSIQARALVSGGDGRINSHGLGGRIEIRAGPLLAAAPITSARTHFGLGEQDGVGVARIVWPNGVAQVEFDLVADQEVTATQRLKGSCPWVFTRAGDAFQFVKDFIWRSPLGMRINSQDTAGVEQTEDWILLPGGLVTAEEGAYEVRITAELWETHFFDHIALRVVDHPASFAAYVDERFVPTQPPELGVIAASHPRAFSAVCDQAGCDVAGLVAEADGRYVADFSLGRFQGIAEDHWVEFQLPDDAPVEQPLVVIGEGWIYPTDSSLNVAISQGGHAAPRGLVLEAYQASSGWHAVSGDLGFPAGKNKTVVIPLPRAAVEEGVRRFRLRTNLEIYWDRLGWGVALPDAELRIAPAETLVAELRHRGFSRLPPPGRRKPDIPVYDQLAGPGPRWRDLEGYYTRYGDVRELLHQIDDRYVIMNAGDEFVLRFAAPPPPPPGWTRDFVLVGDGWVKDGDFNTANSRTVHPLPSHAQSDYPATPQALEDDPVFQRHIEDWRRFHTRYVTPAAFARGLMKSGLTRPEGGTR